MVNPDEYYGTFYQLATREGFHIVELGTVNGSSLLCAERSGPSPDACRCYLSSGVHGDEPAGPLALLNLLEHGKLSPDLSWTLSPLLNPTGFVKGTRENEKGIDLNRDFRTPESNEVALLRRYLDEQAGFDLSISMHEDWESAGFYMYSLSNYSIEKDCREILEAVSQEGPLDLAESIDGHPSVRGLIQRVGSDIELESRPDWPEAFYLYSRSEHPHFTIETPSSLPIEQRISMQIAAVSKTVELFCATGAAKTD